MKYKKKSILITTFLLINILLLLYIKNGQKTSLRFLIWNMQEISIGKLISISFGSGLFLSSILTISTNNENLNLLSNDEYQKDQNNSNSDNNFFDEELRYPIEEMPPERDLRDAQPTISVNYRVLKSNGDRDIDYDDKIIEDLRDNDDWINQNNDW